MAAVGCAFILIFILGFLLLTFFFPVPFGDVRRSVRYRTIPWVTVSLIIINSLVFFLYQATNWYDALMIGDAGSFVSYAKQIWTYGYRESYLREGQSIGAFITFTSIFMHADIFHLLFNMFYLWAFGYRLEDACGPWRFLLFYLLAGMVANLGSVALNPSDVDLPGIGASGAIAGVMGAYLILFHTEWIACIWGLGSLVRLPVVFFLKTTDDRKIKWWRWTIPLPAWLLLGAFLIQNLIPSLVVIREGNDEGGVNNLAHLTGFLAGLAVFLFVRKDLMMRYLQGRAL